MNKDFSVGCNTPVKALRAIPHMETIKNTAKLFGLPEHFVRQKVLSGNVVAVMAGRKYLVNVDRFAEYLNTAKEGMTAGAEEQTVRDIRPIPVDIR